MITNTFVLLILLSGNTLGMSQCVNWKHLIPNTNSERTNCITFSCPKFVVDEEKRCTHPYFEIASNRSDMILNKIEMTAVKGSVRCVSGFNVEDGEGQPYYLSDRGDRGIGFINDKHGRRPLLSIDVHLKINKVLKIVPVKKNDCTAMTFLSINICSVSLSLQVGKCGYSNEEPYNETLPKGYNQDECYNVTWISNNTSEYCHANAPWTFGSAVCKESRSGKESDKVKGSGDSLVLDRTSLVIGATLGGGLALIFFGIVICVFIGKLRLISHRRLEIRRSQIPSTLFIRPGGHTNLRSTKEGSRSRELPDILEMNTRSDGDVREQLVAQNPAPRAISHIYAEPDYNNMSECKQKENEIYLPA